MTNKIKESVEKNAVGGLRFIFDSESKIEALFWIIILLVGTTATVFAIRKQLLSWSEEPITSNLEKRHLNTIPQPAVIVCPNTFDKLGIMEILLNMMDPFEFSHSVVAI